MGNMGKRRAPFSNRSQPVWFVALLFGLLFGVGSNPAGAACGGSPVITTDKPDYGPTETVVISGTGFNCGEAVSVLVTAPDGSTRSGDGTGAAGPDSVVTDGEGAFSIDYHLSATLADGRTYEGQRGVYRVEVLDGSETVLGEGSFSDAGGYFSCALTAAGGVKCWGSGTSGSLGNGSFENSATPVDVIELDGTGTPKLLDGVVQITLGPNHACALTTAGGVKCWGNNSYGQLGNGTFAPIEGPGGFATPGDVMDGSVALTGVTQISAGGWHTCAVITGGRVKCWGNNGQGQLGNGTISASTSGIATPVDVREWIPAQPLTGVAQISAGGYHTCTVSVDGAAKCWGRGVHGQLGVGLGRGETHPADLIGEAVNVKGMSSGVAQISAGFEHTCALTTAGAVKCWGRNSFGQAGHGTFTAREPEPIDVVDGSPSIPLGGVAQISAGGWHTCAITTGGSATCWGFNDSGQLGNGTVSPPTSPGIAMPVNVYGMGGGVAQISGGWPHTCALTTDRHVTCWGSNAQGQLGDGTYLSSAAPVDVIGLTNAVAALWDGEPITPVVPWTFSGFYHPVEMSGVWNTVKGGSTVPIKFQVFAGAAELTDPSIVVQPLAATQTACSGGATNTIELTPTGGTSLRYGGGHFIFNWKTPKMPGYCYVITVFFTNGGSLSANFELR